MVILIGVKIELIDISIKKSIINLSLVNLGEKEGSKTMNKLQKEHIFIIDTIFYIADLISLNIEKNQFHFDKLYDKYNNISFIIYNNG